MSTPASHVPSDRILVDVHLLSQLTGFVPRTIRMWVKSGVLPEPLKLGGRLLWPRDVVDRWINDGCPRGAPHPRTRGRPVRVETPVANESLRELVDTDSDYGSRHNW